MGGRLLLRTKLSLTNLEKANMDWSSQEGQSAVETSAEL